MTLKGISNYSSFVIHVFDGLDTISWLMSLKFKPDLFVCYNFYFTCSWLKPFFFIVPKYLTFVLIQLRERVLLLWHHDEWKQAQTTNLRLWVMVRKKVTNTFCLQGAGFNFSRKKNQEKLQNWFLPTDGKHPPKKSYKNWNWRITFAFSGTLGKGKLEIKYIIMSFEMSTSLFIEEHPLKIAMRNNIWRPTLQLCSFLIIFTPN